MRYSWRNETPHLHHSATRRLFGTVFNPTGIGRRVSMKCGDRTIIRDIFSPNDCLGLGPPELTIGVGSAAKIDSLTIRWASGDEQVLRTFRSMDCCLLGNRIQRLATRPIQHSESTTCDNWPKRLNVRLRDGQSNACSRTGSRTFQRQTHTAVPGRSGTAHRQPMVR